MGKSGGNTLGDLAQTICRRSGSTGRSMPAVAARFLAHAPAQITTLSHVKSPSDVSRPVTRPSSTLIDLTSVPVLTRRSFYRCLGNKTFEHSQRINKTVASANAATYEVVAVHTRHHCRDRFTYRAIRLLHSRVHVVAHPCALDNRIVSHRSREKDIRVDRIRNQNPNREKNRASKAKVGC